MVAFFLTSDFVHLFTLRGFWGFYIYPVVGVDLGPLKRFLGPFLSFEGQMKSQYICVSAKYFGKNSKSGIF